MSLYEGFGNYIYKQKLSEWSNDPLIGKHCLRFSSLLPEIE